VETNLGSWAVGQLGSWAVGQLGSWAVGQLGSWASYEGLWVSGAGCFVDFVFLWYLLACGFL
jgi:hypothetical protein